MAGETRMTVISRRTFIVSAASGLAMSSALAALLIPHSARAGDASGERSALFDAEFKKLVGTMEPIEGKITVDLPEIAENGNFVPLTITVDSAMTADEYVRKIHLLSTNNPVARVATFHLSPANAVARVQSRMRLSKTQDVVVVAEMSNGELAIATTQVKVTIGGCGA